MSQRRIEVIAYTSDVKFGAITYLRNVIAPRGLLLLLGGDKKIGKNALTMRLVVLHGLKSFLRSIMFPICLSVQWNSFLTKMHLAKPHWGIEGKR